MSDHAITSHAHESMSIPTNISITRKRLREEGGEQQSDQRPFTIRSSSRPLAPPRAFRPICLLPRAQLPLAYLDTSAHGSQLFHAHVTVLEASHDSGEEPMILIAAGDGEKNLCAIERVQRRCYTLCRLKTVVTEAMVMQNGIKDIVESSRRPVKRRTVEATTLKCWWKDATVSLPTTMLASPGSSSTRPALDMYMANLKKQWLISDHLESNPALSNEGRIESSDAPPQTEQSADPQDACEELAKHYLDALYISRTSLAYFTKGPLSRARVSLSPSASAINSSDLATFLRQSVLTSVIMDRKYREHVPKIVGDLPAPQLATPDRAAAKTKKKRPKWKPKRTKKGFFSNEYDFVERWWRRDDEGGGDGSAATEAVGLLIRRRCAKLRNRETFLQIILVLEVLALEALAGSNVVEKNEDVATVSESQNAEDAQPELPAKAAKAKKPQNLPMHLEALLDKLCIWQSLETHSPAEHRDSERQIDQNECNDELRNFCIEVIVPFFGSRIPEYASMVNKKFGGPSAASPAKRTSTSVAKSGDAAKWKMPSKSAEPSLQKVSNDRQKYANISRPSSLHRLSTDSSSFPSIKRELSEISMDLIPTLKNGPAHSRSASVVPKLQQFTKREVDLNAVSASTEAKIRKKKDVESKLKEAVEMLKKPNRALAVKDDETRVDERFVKATAGKSKLKTNAPHNARKRDSDIQAELQVSSTPSHSRAVKATPYQSSHYAPQEIIGSNESRTTYVPSSSLRPSGGVNLPATMSTPSVPRTIQRVWPDSSIQDTPSRGFAKFLPAGLAHPPGMDTSIPPRASAMLQQSPSRPAMGPLVEASPNLSRAQARREGEGETRDLTIYDALGWDDQGYEQLD